METRTREKIMYILMPFRDHLDPVFEVLKDVAGYTGYECVRADKDLSVKDITEKIILGIYKSEIVIADLSDANPNVLYELGIANALSKECLMLCQQPHEDLPFDIKQYTVQRYENTEEGRQALKERLIKILKNPARIESPVNRALDAVLRKNRTLSYMAAGAIAGVILSFPASLVTAIFGHDLLAKWHPQHGVFRTIIGGVPFSFIAGGLFFGAWSIVANQYEWCLRRYAVLVGEILAGLAVGVISFGALFLLAVGTLGLEVAISMAVPWLLLYTVGGLAFGLTLDVQMTRFYPRSVAFNLTKTILVFGTFCTLFVLLIDGFKDYLFFPAYLERYDIWDIVGDAIRAGLWGIGMVTIHWWLKWRKRL